MKKDHKHKSHFAGAALVAGAALGAAAVALSDKDTRDKLVKSANSFKDQAMKKFDKEVKPWQKKAERAVDEKKKVLEKKTLDKAVTEVKKAVEKKLEEKK